MVQELRFRFLFLVFVSSNKLGRILEVGQVGQRVAIHPRDELGFWELRGYHHYGDPWREQRYTND
jgi:DMSO/TMAO reductase YedYZ molybdopterin-dependent catalytic subunit